jgi:hypothetical protein
VQEFSHHHDHVDLHFLAPSLNFALLLIQLRYQQLLRGLVMTPPRDSCTNGKNRKDNKNLQAPFLSLSLSSLPLLRRSTGVQHNKAKKNRMKQALHQRSHKPPPPKKKLTPKKKKENTSQAQNNNNTTTSQRT